jgi:hypothetical protein
MRSCSKKNWECILQGSPDEHPFSSIFEIHKSTGGKNAAAFHTIWQCLGPKPKSPGCTPSLASEMLRLLEGLLEDTEVIQPKVELILRVGLSNKCIFLQRLDTYPFYIYI